MESYSWLIPFLVLLFLFAEQRKRKIAVIHMLNHKKHSKEQSTMKELAKQFVGEECLIYTVTGFDSAIQGTIREVTDGGLIVEKKDGIEAVNLEYVTRIRQYPRKKNGKKKSIAAD